MVKWQFKAQRARVIVFLLAINTVDILRPITMLDQQRMPYF